MDHLKDIKWDMEWANRVGIILGFFSFWFAAPELIGEERLKIMEKRIADIIAGIRVAMVWTVCALSVIMGIWIAYEYNKHVSLILNDGNHPESLIVFVYCGIGVLYLIALIINPVDKLAEQFMARLASDSKRRQNSFILGAILFTSGVLMQFIATFWI